MPRLIQNQSQATYQSDTCKKQCPLTRRDYYAAGERQFVVHAPTRIDHAGAICFHGCCGTCSSRHHCSFDALRDPPCPIRSQHISRSALLSDRTLRQQPLIACRMICPAKYSDHGTPPLDPRTHGKARCAMIAAPPSAYSLTVDKPRGPRMKYC